MFIITSDFFLQIERNRLVVLECWLDSMGGSEILAKTLFQTKLVSIEQESDKY